MATPKRRLEVSHDLRVFEDVSALAAAAAQHIGDVARRAVEHRGSCTLAVSGGRTPSRMFHELATLEVPWASIVIFQVDERVAPADDDDDRNLVALRASLGSAPAVIDPMPVNDADIHQAAHEYAARLPDRFDLVHLGLGSDGHTASLVSGDPILEDSDDLVGVSTVYRGQRRMTMTLRALSRADEILWVVSGAEKRLSLRHLLAGDQLIPAGRVSAARSIVMADRAAIS